MRTGLRIGIGIGIGTCGIAGAAIGHCSAENQIARAGMQECVGSQARLPGDGAGDGEGSIDTGPTSASPRLSQAPAQPQPQLF